MENTCAIKINPCGEFQPDLTKINFENLRQSNSGYILGIVNSSYPKFFLLDDPELKNWHIVHLTRNDKIGHFISEWIWRQNPKDSAGVMIEQYHHHGGTSHDYQSLANNPVHCNLTQVIEWLKEDLINYHVQCDYRLDYSALSTMQTENIQWYPNQYNLQLKDLFINHVEVENLLRNFKI
jgi:hypothetical protein